MALVAGAAKRTSSHFFPIHRDAVTPPPTDDIDPSSGGALAVARDAGVDVARARG